MANINFFDHQINDQVINNYNDDPNHQQIDGRVSHSVYNHMAMIKKYIDEPQNAPVFDGQIADQWANPAVVSRDFEGHNGRYVNHHDADDIEVNDIITPAASEVAGSKFFKKWGGVWRVVARDGLRLTLKALKFKSFLKCHSDEPLKITDQIYFDPLDDVDYGYEIIKTLNFDDDHFKPLRWFKIRPGQVEPVIFKGYDYIDEPCVWVDDEGEAFEGVDGLL